MKLDTSIPGIKKYYIGFGVFGLIIVVLAIYTLSLAGSAKQDKVTVTKAQEVAKKLNDYVRSNRKIPDDLSVLDVADIPNTIEYTKKSDTQYEFCVTYKTASSYSTPDITSTLTTPLLGGYGSGASLDDYYIDEEVSTYKPSSLYISSYSHKKGQDCQTIEPYISSSSLRSTTPTPKIDTIQPSSTGDTERLTDINSLRAQLEAAYAQLGYYPTRMQLNTQSWRDQNMPGLDKEVLKAPGGSSYTIYSIPSLKQYGYVPYKDGTNSLSCDNVTAATYCSHYTLYYEQSTGQQLKSSLN